MSENTKAQTKADLLEMSAQAVRNTRDLGLARNLHGVESQLGGPTQPSGSGVSSQT
jgi:hypothetical protein